MLVFAFFIGIWLIKFKFNTICYIFFLGIRLVNEVKTVVMDVNDVVNGS